MLTKSEVERERDSESQIWQVDRIEFKSEDERKIVRMLFK